MLTGRRSRQLFQKIAEVGSPNRTARSFRQIALRVFQRTAEVGSLNCGWDNASRARLPMSAAAIHRRTGL
jgi:hypothetical protein